MTIKKHYVSNKTLYEEMVSYRERVEAAKRDGTEAPRASNYIGEAITLICSRLSLKPNFINYPYREEMIADGIENCIIAINSFNPEKSTNPFAYFTQIAYNAFIRRIQKEKKHMYVKYKNYQNMMIDDYITEEDHVLVSVPSNEVADTIILSFEEKNKTSSKEKKNRSKIGIERFAEEVREDG